MPRAVPALVSANVLVASGDLMSVDVGTIVVEIVLFLLLVAAMRAIVFKPLMKVLEARDRAIDGKRDEAEARMREADARTAEYEEKLREVRARAAAERDALRAEGRKAEMELLEKVKAETAKVVEDGKAAVRKEADRIRQELDAANPALAASMAERVLGGKPGASS